MLNKLLNKEKGPYHTTWTSDNPYLLAQKRQIFGNLLYWKATIIQLSGSSLNISWKIRIFHTKDPTLYSSWAWLHLLRKCPFVSRRNQTAGNSKSGEIFNVSEHRNTSLSCKNPSNLSNKTSNLSRSILKNVKSFTRTRKPCNLKILKISQISNFSSYFRVIEK